ncbi:MAG TPA: response regulator [Candidatus Angelobacter sp.]|nr:response regulator [Candidatus Angelobacter sp.]
MRRVLIVEDKDTSRELLRTVLEKQGYVVIEASDGEEALQTARAEIPDLILLDLHMPRRNGYEVLIELRKDQRFVAVPIVAVTASAMQGDREKALAAGFSGYLSKPLSLANLRSEIQRLLPEA